MRGEKTLVFTAGAAAGVAGTVIVYTILKILLPLLLVLAAILGLYYFGWRKPRQRRAST